jgi:uncharacterized protein YacL (UPF0231 family)
MKDYTLCVKLGVTSAGSVQFEFITAKTIALCGQNELIKVLKEDRSFCETLRSGSV